MAAVQFGGQPATRTLVAREHLDEVLARHAGLAHADVEDFALERADLLDQAAHAVAQALDVARREADVHQLRADLVACGEVVLVLGAAGFQRLGHLVVEAAYARELLQRIGLHLQQVGRSGRAAVVLVLFRLVARLFIVIGSHGSLDLLGVELLLGVRIDEAVDHLVDAHLVALDLAGQIEDLLHRGRTGGDRLHHVLESFLDALGDLDLALAREQFHRAHLAHVHAHRVGGAAELGIHRRQRGFCLLFHVLVARGHRRGVGVDQQRFLVWRLVEDLDAHVTEGGDDRFDLLRVDQVVRQVVIDLGIGEEATLLAQLDQVAQTHAPRLGILLGQFRGVGEKIVLLALASRAAFLARDALGDLGLQQIERRLGALDHRFSALGGSLRLDGGLGRGGGRLGGGLGRFLDRLALGQRRRFGGRLALGLRLALGFGPARGDRRRLLQRGLLDRGFLGRRNRLLRRLLGDDGLLLDRRLGRFDRLANRGFRFQDLDRLGFFLSRCNTLDDLLYLRLTLVFGHARLALSIATMENRQRAAGFGEPAGISGMGNPQL
jgi:hypothetical protein